MSENFQTEPLRDVRESEELRDFTPPRHQRNLKGTAWLLIGGGIVLLLVFGGVFLAGVFFWLLKSDSAPVPAADPSPGVVDGPAVVRAHVDPPMRLDQVDAVARIRNRGGWVQFDKGEVRKIAFDEDTTDDDLEALKLFPKVKWLSLSNTKVTDEGLKHLRGLADLNEVDLEKSKVTEEGVRQLQQALPKLRITR